MKNYARIGLVVAQHVLEETVSIAACAASVLYYSNRWESAARGSRHIA